MQRVSPLSLSLGVLLGLTGCATTPVGTLTAPVAAAVTAPTLTTATAPPVDPLNFTGTVEGAFVAFDNFEHGINDWQVDGGTPDVTFRLLKAHSCSGEYVVHFGRSDGANFTGITTDATFTYAKTLDLTQVAEPILSYVVKSQTSPASALSLQPELRKVGGDWTALGGAVPSLYDTGFTRQLDLSGLSGSQVQLRFQVHLEASAASFAGLYLDDVGVIDNSASP